MIDIHYRCVKSWLNIRFFTLYFELDKRASEVDMHWASENASILEYGNRIAAWFYSRQHCWIWGIQKNCFVASVGYICTRIYIYIISVLLQASWIDMLYSIVHLATSLSCLLEYGCLSFLWFHRELLASPVHQNPLLWHAFPGILWF